MEDFITEELVAAFHQYVSMASQKLQPRKRGDARKGELIVFENRALELQMLVNELESKSNFSALVQETSNALSKLGVISLPVFLAFHVQNFFRRSGYYSAAFNGRNPNIDDTLRTYIEAFTRKEVQVTYLAPIEFVDFSEPYFDFNTFKICKFSPAELEELLQNDVNKIFYEYAVVDVSILSQYWFLVVTEQAAASELNTITEEPLPSRILMRYADFPPGVAMAIQQIALYDWSPWSRLSYYDEDLRMGWHCLNFPFLITVDDNLLERPKVAPDTSGLSTMPDEETHEDIPALLVDMNEDGSPEHFRKFVQMIGNLFSSLRSDQEAWPFLEAALNYFLKAFFSEGLEQLLWHITVIEAILGDRDPGLTSRLRKRLALILAETDNKRKAVKKRFDELYQFRSDLVHGNYDLAQKEIYLVHLREAHEFARRTLLWFLKYRIYVTVKYSEEGGSGAIPSREDMIYVLDLEPKSRSRIKWLIEILPDEFPSMLRRQK